MDMTLAGFIALGALITGLFAWLRQDIRELSKDMDSKIDSLRKDLESKVGGLREELHKLSERVARIEGMLEAAIRRRDLTPFPEPPPSGGRPDEPRAA